MDIENLQIFIAVVRHGSFSSVARQRNVSPSAVSRVIASMEQELEVRLFHRTTRALSLTEAGAEYFDRIAPLAEELVEAGLTARDWNDRIQGRVKITASPSFGVACLAPLLTGLADRYPDLCVELTLTDKVEDLLGSGLDLAIRQGPLASSSLVTERFLNTHYRACASPGYLRQHGVPQLPHELDSHRCLTFPFAEYNSCWRFRRRQQAYTVQNMYGSSRNALNANESIKDNRSTESVAIQSPLLINNGQALKQCALNDGGIILLSCWLVETELTNGTLVDVFPYYDVAATEFATTISFVYPSRSYVPKKVRAVMEFLRESFA